MGYRTSGRWVIKGPADQIKAMWVSIRLNPPNKPVNAADMLAEYDVYEVGGMGFIRLTFDDNKWYESFPDVQFHEAVWQMMVDYHYEAEDREARRICGKRVHIGEDNQTDEQSFGDYDIQLGTQCDFYDDEPSPPAKDTT